MQTAPPITAPLRPKDELADKCLKSSESTQLTPKPTLWRIIRAYLNVRESAKAQYIFEYVKMHRPMTKRADFDDKLKQMIKHADIKRVRHGVYAITQQGKKDLVGPDGEGLVQDEPQATQEPNKAPTRVILSMDESILTSHMSTAPMKQAASERIAQETPTITPVHVNVNGQDVIVNLKIRVSLEIV